MSATMSHAELANDICKYVEEHKARYKWPKGRIEFVDVIPKSPNGKILRRLIRDKDIQAMSMREAKLKSRLATEIPGIGGRHLMLLSQGNT